MDNNTYKTINQILKLFGCISFALIGLYFNSVLAGLAAFLIFLSL